MQPASQSLVSKIFKSSFLAIGAGRAGELGLTREDDSSTEHEVGILWRRAGREPIHDPFHPFAAG
jgi:hypothetical protein